MIDDEKMKQFESLSKPLIQFIRSSLNPHVSIIITAESAEIVQGIGVVQWDDGGANF